MGEKDKGQKEAGLLLRRRYDAKNALFVFIPDRQTYKTVQTIEYHMEFDGSVSEVDKHIKDFDSQKESFLKAFPSIAESKR